MLNNTVEIILHRQDFNTWLGIDLTDEQWYALSADVEDALQEEVIPNYVYTYTIDYINELVEDERKYE